MHRVAVCLRPAVPVRALAASCAPRSAADASALARSDPAVHRLLQGEYERQKRGIQLIASEVRAATRRGGLMRAEPHVGGGARGRRLAHDAQIFRGLSGRPVRVATNRTSSRCSYYGGNEFIDANERLCQERALAAFSLDPAQWGVNVQALSGTPAHARTRARS